MSLRALTLAIGTLIGSTALAADWPQWRGPNQDAICKETGLLKSWPADGPNLVWTAEKLGLGYGTPSIADGKIFGCGKRDVKDKDGKDAKEDGIWALNESNGKELWFTSVDKTRDFRNNNGPASTPTYHKGKVYAVTNFGTLACLDAANGKVVWKKSYKDKDTFGGSDPSWGYNDSVIVDGNKVICAPSGSKAAVAALNADTGAIIWTTPLKSIGGGFGYSTPVKATIGGVAQYVVLLGDRSGLVGVNAETGKLLWQHDSSTAAKGGVAQIPTPIVKGDSVWFSTGYGGGSTLLKIKGSATTEFSAEVVNQYTAAELKNHHGGMVLVGDYIYFGHGQNAGAPRCVDIRTGEVMWKMEPFPGALVKGRGSSSSYLYADGNLYIRYEGGRLFLVKPSPKMAEVQVSSSFQLPKPNTPDHTESWPHPVIANGKLYIRDQNNLYCYDVKDGTN